MFRDLSLSTAGILTDKCQNLGLSNIKTVRLTFFQNTFPAGNKCSVHSADQDLKFFFHRTNFLSIWDLTA